MSADEEEPEVPISNFIIPILRIIRNAQLQHGLRHGDHQRYRQFLSKKIRRMRKCLDFKFGNRSKVTVKKLTPAVITDSRFIMLRVFEIERCWAYSTQLKDEVTNDPRKKFHARNRLRKGVKLADELSEIIKEFNRFDSSTLLELKAYIAWIKGQFFFEKEEWAIAKEFLETANKIYKGLSEALLDESKDIYTTKCDEINPQIRYCAYNCGDQTAGKDSKKAMNIDRVEYLDALLQSCSKEDVEKITEVKWFDETIPVKSEKVKMFILSLKTHESELDATPKEEYQKKIGIYENSILKGCSEAISALKEEIKLIDASVTSAVASATGDLASLKISSKVAASNIPASNEKIGKIHLLLNYLQWSKGQYLISRNLLQIKNALKTSGTDILSSSVGTPIATAAGGVSIVKPNEMARLYDSVMQSLNDISLISGPPRDNEAIAEILKLKQLAYRCFRCYYLALSHFNNKSFVQCLGLLQRSRENVTEFESQLKNLSSSNSYESKIPGDSFKQLKASLTKLDSRCQAEELTCKAQRILQIAAKSDNENTENDLEDENKKVNKKPLIESYDKFFTEKQIEKTIGSTYKPFVEVVPGFQPVPMKPIFFDLALNYIDYPSTTPGTSKSGATDSSSAEGSKGLTGMVKGWLWG